MKQDFILKLAKGFRGRSSKCYRLAKPKVQKGLLYAYRDRRAKKRTLRSSFITQINAGTRLHNMAYSQFMHGLVVNNIHLNRKMLADLAVNEPYSFQALVCQVKSTIPTRDTRAKSTTLLPEKLKFVPMDWETIKAQVQLSDELKALEATSDVSSQLDSFFIEPISQAKQKNIEDLKAGKYEPFGPKVYSTNVRKPKV